MSTEENPRFLVFSRMRNHFANVMSQSDLSGSSDTQTDNPEETAALRELLTKAAESPSNVPAVLGSIAASPEEAARLEAVVNAVLWAATDAFVHWMEAMDKAVRDDISDAFEDLMQQSTFTPPPVS
jgi:hypothetical protein